MPSRGGKTVLLIAAALTAALLWPGGAAAGDCPGVWLPVCGSDGVTYENECEARLAGVGIARPGVCKPEDAPPCPDIRQPVCGTDGRTYGNACEARNAGVEVRHSGDCGGGAPPPDRPGPRVCGGIAGLGCGRGEYCHMEPGKCRVPDWQGVCRRRPFFCPRHYAAVCGCDSRTYNNDCETAARGVNVLYVGPCSIGHERQE